MATNEGDVKVTRQEAKETVRQLMLKMAESGDIEHFIEAVVCVAHWPDASVDFVNFNVERYLGDRINPETFRRYIWPFVS